MKRSSLADQYCAIARPSAELTDAWSFVIFREIMLGNRRFDGLQEQTGMSPRSLTLRLASLCKHTILERVLYQPSPKRYEYRLTKKGQELWPVIILLKQWGEKWCGPWGEDEYPMTLMHRDTGHALTVKLVCETCGEPVDAHSATGRTSETMKEERASMAARHAAKLIRAKKKTEQ